MNAHESGSGTADTEHADREPTGRIDRYFEITARGSTVNREIRGGLVTFFTMAYIVVLNPLIVGTAADVNGDTLGVSRVAAVTALVAGVMTILMGVVGRYPFALATGLGLNAFVATTVVSEMTWADAMGLIVLEGLIILVIVLTGFRTAVFNAVPSGLKTATGVGIGLYIALIGFVDAGFVQRVPDAAGTTVPVELGSGGSLIGWPSLVFVIGVLLLAVLVTKRVRGAILIGIAVTTVLAIVTEGVANLGQAGANNPGGWSLVVPEIPGDVVGIPDLSLLGDFSLFGSFERVGAVAAVLFVFTLMLADFFDTMGTVVGVGDEAGLLDKQGKLPGIGRVFFVDSLAAVAGGAASTSSNTTYVESAAGVGEGARTGLASVVTGTLFLLAMFVAPLVSVVPFEAASPALVLVGFLMLTQIRNIDFGDLGLAIPAFLTMILMPYTYSITNGIGAGFVSYVAIRLFQGRAREVHPLMWFVALLFVVYFAIGPIEAALGIG